MIENLDTNPSQPGGRVALSFDKEGKFAVVSVIAHEQMNSASELDVPARSNPHFLEITEYASPSVQDAP